MMRQVRAMGIRDHPTAARAPWQTDTLSDLSDPFVACIDHVVVLGEAHLRRVLTAYATYYNDIRTHLALNKDAPSSRGSQLVGSIAALPVSGGLQSSICSGLSFG